MSPLILIDLSATFWPAYFGPGNSALDGYEKTLERIEWYVREFPGSVVVCCDSPVSKRKEIDPTYKSARKPMPVDGVEALRAVQERVRQWGTPVAQVEGYEADDLVAALAEQAWPRDVQVIGSEKDFYCLISDRVTLIGKNGPIDADACERKFGVRPGQMTDFLALTGDASDGIKGCAGIGIVKAQAILQEYATLAAAQGAAQDGSLRIEGIGATLLANLAAYDPAPAMAMLRLMRDAPVDLDALLYGAPEPTAEPFPEEPPF